MLLPKNWLKDETLNLLMSQEETTFLTEQQTTDLIEIIRVTFIFIFGYNFNRPLIEWPDWYSGWPKSEYPKSR